MKIPFRRKPKSLKGVHFTPSPVGTTVLPDGTRVTGNREQRRELLIKALRLHRRQIRAEAALKRDAER